MRSTSFGRVIAIAAIAFLFCRVLSSAEPPRLMVVMCVDQLCQDYLVRFRSELRENDCFLTAQRTGVAYINCHHQHAFTFTGPGHATLATGTYPNRHGIIGNSWYSPELGKTVRSIDDADATIIGSATLTQGASSKRLLAPTLGDTLKLSTGKKATCRSGCGCTGTHRNPQSLDRDPSSDFCQYPRTVTQQRWTGRPASAHAASCFPF